MKLKDRLYWFKQDVLGVWRAFLYIPHRIYVWRLKCEISMQIDREQKKAKEGKIK